MLTEIPLRLREHANRLAEGNKNVQTQRTAIERQALEAEGILKFESNLEVTEKALKQAELMMGLSWCYSKTNRPCSVFTDGYRR